MVKTVPLQTDQIKSLVKDVIHSNKNMIQDAIDSNGDIQSTSISVAIENLIRCFQENVPADHSVLTPIEMAQKELLTAADSVIFALIAD